MLGAFLVEESESESESVVAGDQEGEDVEENPSDAAGDGDGESAGTLIILTDPDLIFRKVCHHLRTPIRKIPGVCHPTLALCINGMGG